MTNATHDCTGCPVSAGTHKPADAVHTEIADPNAPAVPEPWGACVGGRIWIGKLPDHVHKLAVQEGVDIQRLYTEQQVRAMLAAGVPAAAPDARDAARWRESLKHVYAATKGNGQPVFGTRLVPSESIYRTQLTAADQFTKDVDAAIAAQAGKGVQHGAQ